jgi:hypothetical protein
MHPLVGAVLLRTRRGDALMHDAELHPPDIQGGQALNARRGEGRPVVGADGVRQAHLAEERAEDRFRALSLHRMQAVTREHAATEVVGHRERIAILAVARAELALEVGGPDLLGR